MLTPVGAAPQMVPQGPGMRGRLVMLITGLGYGGAEVQVLLLSRELRRRGWTLSVVSMTKPGAIAEDFVDAGIEVCSLGMRRGVPDPLALARAVRLLRRIRPDILHCHMVHANILGRIAGRIAAVPAIVCTAHNVSEGGLLREVLYRATDRLCEVTTNVCRAGVQRYVERRLVRTDRIRYLPNAIVIDGAAPDDGDHIAIRSALGLDARFTWLAVGRLEAQKDYLTMLRAFAETRTPDTALLIAGDGSERGMLERAARELGLAERVRFLGTRRDVHALMHAADAFVLSSVYEGMPMVLLEAAAAGLPIVATEVGGVPEVVRHGESGYLVPPCHPSGLATMLDSVAATPRDALVLMGAAGRAHVRRTFDLTLVVDRWEELYRGLLDGSPVPSGAEGM